ncbi:hypothetical protein CEXT_126171 [Caerostris extrusa]|uniref:Uncharacterized protein n=1 Tax=Caerostris extrusa TaxID=172846 RepID=A0AAV4XH73_CAEEX|nr:hypothetical protein CEXT_126171 [Caerostris extrusa]
MRGSQSCMYSYSSSQTAALPKMISQCLENNLRRRCQQGVVKEKQSRHSTTHAHLHLGPSMSGTPSG